MTKVKRTDDAGSLNIGSREQVTVTTMNHMIEVQYMAKMNTSMPIRKLDADRYVLLETGEVMEFNKSENRAGSFVSLKKTFKRLRYLINNNFMGAGNELHVTLTYAENMTDTKRLYKDFEKFAKKMARVAANMGSTLDYLCVVEPQGRGAWHCHVLMRFNELERAYVPKQVIADKWGHGFVEVDRLENVDNIGAYLSAYLADVSLDEMYEVARNSENAAAVISSVKGLEIVDKEINGEKKAFIKGGRLHMYPSGMNLYRSSRGIAMPERERMTYEDIKKVVGSAQPHYSKAYELYDDEDECFNALIFEQYNLKR